MTTDKHDAVINPVYARQRLLEFAVDGPLARYQAAGRSRGPVAVNRRLGGVTDGRMPRQTKVVVAGKICVLNALNVGGRAGEPVMTAEVGIGDTESAGAFAQNAQLLVIGMQVEAVPAVGNRIHRRARCVAGVLQGRRAAVMFGLAQAALQTLLDQALLDRRGQAAQRSAGPAHRRFLRVSERGAPVRSLAWYSEASIGLTCST